MLCVLMIAAARAADPTDRALEEYPAWRTSGEEVRLTAIRELLSIGSTMSALDIIAQMRAEKNENPELDLLQGKALRLDGVTSEAERLLLLAEKRMGRDGRPSAELCILYADLQQVDDAVRSCQRATQLDEYDGASWNNLAYLLLADGQPVPALEAAENAVRVDATQPRYRNNLGLVQAALGRVDVAFRTLKSTMSTGDAAYMIGLVLERYASMEEASAWMERALKHEPKHPGATAWLADLDGGSPSAPTPTVAGEAPLAEVP